MTKSYVTPSQRVVLEMLINRAAVNTESMIDRLWQHDPNGGPEDARAIVRRHICRLRQFLAQFGVTIETEYGQGYRIPTAEMRAMAAEACAISDEERWSNMSRSSGVGGAAAAAAAA